MRLDTGLMVLFAVVTVGVTMDSKAVTCSDASSCAPSFGNAAKDRKTECRAVQRSLDCFAKVLEECRRNASAMSQDDVGLMNHVSLQLGMKCTEPLSATAGCLGSSLVLQMLLYCLVGLLALPL